MSEWKCGICGSVAIPCYLPTGSDEPMTDDQLATITNDLPGLNPADADWDTSIELYDYAVQLLAEVRRLRAGSGSVELWGRNGQTRAAT